MVSPMCFTQYNAWNWGFPGCQVPKRWEYSQCWVSPLGHHLCCFLSTPCTSPWGRFQRRNSVVKQQRSPSAAMELHVRTWSHGTDVLSASSDDPAGWNNGPRSDTVMYMGVPLERQLSTTAACKKWYIFMNRRTALTCSVKPRVTVFEFGSLSLSCSTNTKRICMVRWILMILGSYLSVSNTIRDCFIGWLDSDKEI